MPHKKFQHFIKWFDIFIRAKTNIQKKKGKIKQKRKRKSLPVALGEGPVGPAHQAVLSSSSRAPKQLGGEAPTPWTPPQRPRGSRPPQLTKARQGDACIALSHSPPSPLRPEPSPRFPLLPREHPPFAAVRNRSQRRREARRPCPPRARSWPPQRARRWERRTRGYRHNRSFLLAGAAARFP